MKLIVRHLLVGLALLGISVGSARASEHSFAILNDGQMASIKGGLCVFEVCEDPPGTGVCQPYYPSTKELCGLTKCQYDQTSVGGVEVFDCVFSGPFTCSNKETYRKCVLALKLSFCSNGNDPLYCGVIIEPYCSLDVSERTCVCEAVDSGVPCEWTNCSP